MGELVTGRRLAVATLLCAVFIFALGSAAFAVTSTGPATWSGHTPADASTVGVPRPVISATAVDAKGLQGSPYYSVKLDGLAQSASMSRASSTQISLTFTPRVDLANGMHTVYMSVKNSAGVYSTTTWTFMVSNAPKPSAPSPVPGSTINTTGPTISVAVAGAITGLTSTVVVDGVTVPSSFNAGTGLVTAPTSGLANDQSHDVTVTVVNSAGNTGRLNWSFSIQVYEPMPTPAQDCVSCHPGFPAAHPMDNCLACHGEGSPVGEGWNTPDYAPHSYTYIASSADSCVNCHTAGYATVPAMHSFTPVATYHDSSSTNCGPCHVKSLTTEHYRYGLECFSCHANPDPLVQTAIATGRTDCAACHTGAGQHAQLHETTVPVSCAGEGCHAGTGLGDIHGSNVTCDTCHKSADPRVVAAIAGHVKACDACHDATGHEAVHTITPRTDACVDCHAGSSLTALHITSGGTFTCATCHKSANTTVTDAITAHDKNCATCHATGSYHSAAASKHALPTTPTCVGAGCHDATAAHVIEGKTVDQIHSSATTTVAGATLTSCQICHAAGRTPTTDCGTCHPERLLPHGYDAAKHQSSESCLLTCHSAELKPAHSAQVTATTVACSGCHATLVSQLAGWKGTCAECHSTIAHATANHAGTDAGVRAVRPNGYGCSTSAPGNTDCHDISNLSAVHYDMAGHGCAVCHGTGKTPAPECITCHPNNGAVDYTVTTTNSSTANLYPTSDSSLTPGMTYTVTPASPSTRWDKVDETGAGDGDSTYMSFTGIGAGTATFGFASPTIPAGATISNVTVYVRAKKTTSTVRYIRGQVDVGGTMYAAGTANVQPGTTWTTGTGSAFQLASNPKSGQPWTVADVTDQTGSNALRGIGVQVTSIAAANNMSITQCYALVNYTTSSTVTNVAVGSSTYHHNNVKYIVNPADAGGKRFAVDPASGWNDALYYQDCYDFCHTNQRPAPAAYSAPQGSWMYNTASSDYGYSPTTRTMTLKSLAVPASAPVLTFKTNYQMGIDAAGYVEVSTNGGTSWTALTGTVGGASKAVLNGTAGAWKDASYDLSAYAGQTVQLRLRFYAGVSSNEPGWAFDSLVVSGTGGTVFSDDAETVKPEWENKYWGRSHGAYKGW